MKLLFNSDGIYQIKKGKKKIGNIVDREVFYNKVLKNKYEYSKKYPYNLELIGIGSRECSSLEEAKEKCFEYTKIKII